MNNPQLTDFLKKTYLFENLKAEELESLSEIAKTKDVIAGDYVFDEGTQATSLYILKSGAVEILKKASGGDEQTIAQISTGSPLGEMAFVDRMPRAAAAMVRENTKLIDIPYDALDKLIQSQPAIGHKIYKSIAVVLCRRIRQTSGDLSSLKELKLRHI